MGSASWVNNCGWDKYSTLRTRAILVGGVGDLTGHHVGLVPVRDGNHHIRILRTRPAQYFWVARLTDNGANIEAVLKFLEFVDVKVDHGNVIGFLSQHLGHGRTDLACA